MHSEVRRLPEPGAVLALLKPVTWFPPIWAFLCGLVSVRADLWGGDLRPWLGLLVAGPGVCAASQAVNDWFDRHVDAINEPHRPIPSGRIPGRWGLWLAIGWTGLSFAVGSQLGAWGWLAVTLGLALAWAYSAPPLRLKRNGWVGNMAVGVSYEGLAWVTGAAVGQPGLAPTGLVLVCALLYSLGAHGIMTLNDFKSQAGDRRMGIGSLPVRLGPARAAWVACGVMLVPQLAVIGILVTRGALVASGVILALVLAQAALMVRLVRAPTEGNALWYSARGVVLYVSGMMVSAMAIRPPVQP